MSISKNGWAFIKSIVFFVSLSPFVILVYDTFQDQLGANPIESLHFRLGDWAIRFICLSLALTPIKKVLHQSWPTRFRRMIGLFAFFYALMHFLVFIILDISLSWEVFIDEVSESPYIIAGLLTFTLLIPLAFTSTKAMQKRLGKKWITLHKLVYLVGIGAVIHYLWLVKSDYKEALVYALIIFILLGFRLACWGQTKVQQLSYSKNSKL